MSTCVHRVDGCFGVHVVYVSCVAAAAGFHLIVHEQLHCSEFEAEQHAMVLPVYFFSDDTGSHIWERCLHNGWQPSELLADWLAAF